MAEGDDSNSWENWLGGWVQTAKEKSNIALEFVKKDLAEFTCTLQKETEKAVEKTTSSLTREKTEQATHKVRAGISSFFDNISKALVIPPDDNYVPVRVTADGSGLYDRGKARLHAIQLDASTYVDPPGGSAEQYEMWITSFNMDEHKGEVSEVLVSKVEVRALYTKLVPNEVSHAEFWQRYFYRVHQLECDEARKQALMQRADQARGEDSWEDDWSGGEDEEDDGNQSDWEKMPRPSETKPIQPTTSDTSSMPSSKSSAELGSASSSMTTDCEEPQLNSKKDEPKCPDIPSKDVASSEAKPELSVSTQSPATLDQVSCDPSSSSSQAISTSFPNAQSCQARLGEESSSPSDDHTSSSHHGPSDTACASHPHVVIDESVTSETSVEPGSPANVFREGERGQGEDMSSGAAAASSVEVLTASQDKADGACGASGFGGFPQAVSKPPDNEHMSMDIPAASFSSVSEESSTQDSGCDIKPSRPVVASGITDSPPVKEPSLQKETQDKEEKQVETFPSTTESDIPSQSSASEIGMRVKGDMVVVGGSGSPSSDSSETKELALDEDWEHDFDVEVTEEDLKAAEDIAKKLGGNLDAEDDWENWE